MKFSMRRFTVQNMIAISIIAILASIGQTQKTLAIRFGANNCVKNCFQNYPTFFYCTSSRTTGWCCPDASRIECQDNPQNEVVCSNGAAFANQTKYAFCPRSMSACGTAGPVLYPLMTNNQTLLV